MAIQETSPSLRDFEAPDLVVMKAGTLRHKGSFLTACAVALTTAFFLTPRVYHIDHVSLKLVFFAPFYLASL